MIVTITWNAIGFDNLVALPKSATFNATDYPTEIVQRILEWKSTGGARSARRLRVHAGNTRPHTARSSIDVLKANEMRRAPDPASSRDLSPSDFYLGGDVKRRRSGRVFDSPDELLSAIEGILGGFESQP
jgi:hypothetical protein